MRLPVRSGLAALATVILATSGQAQSGMGSGMPDGVRNGMAPPDCTAAPELPPELAAWPDRTAQAAAADASDLPAARITIGKAVDAGLRPTPEVRYALRPEKPGGSVSFGGLYALTVEQAGHYRIALGSAAWIDLAQEGKALVSTAHGHGPDCTGIRKMVDFSLAPGRYLLQVSANAAPDMPLLVTRLP